jgi:hypothetical protein
MWRVPCGARFWRRNRPPPGVRSGHSSASRPTARVSRSPRDGVIRKTSWPASVYLARRSPVRLVQSLRPLSHSPILRHSSRALLSRASVFPGRLRFVPSRSPILPTYCAVPADRSPVLPSRSQVPLSCCPVLPDCSRILRTPRPAFPSHRSILASATASSIGTAKARLRLAERWHSRYERSVTIYAGGRRAAG